MTLAPTKVPHLGLTSTGLRRYAQYRRTLLSGLESALGSYGINAVHVRVA